MIKLSKFRFRLVIIILIFLVIGSSVYLIWDYIILSSHSYEYFLNKDKEIRGIIGVMLRLSGKNYFFTLDSPQGKAINEYVENLVRHHSGDALLTSFGSEDYYLLRKKDFVQIVYPQPKFISSDFLKKMYNIDGIENDFLFIPLSKKAPQVSSTFVIVSGIRDNTNISALDGISKKEVKSNLQYFVKLYQ